jgi:L-seryl-tRNA(Ser) seleniumtransferase
MSEQIEERLSESEVRSRMRQLPSLDALLALPEGHQLVADYGRALAVEALRNALDRHRDLMLTGASGAPAESGIFGDARQWLADLLRPTLRPVINATGVIVHTNLGRAPMSGAALGAIERIGAGYSNLEYDLAEGARGSRSIHAEDLLSRLTGSEAALVVNNNAAAVLLVLTALCQGREVIISRGQLVEIGGGFRVPDVMAQSGALLVEVGTTNRTHLRDYADAVGDETAAILVAHHSNFKIVGFATEPGLRSLANLTHERDILLLYDQGSGNLLDTTQFGLGPEPIVADSLQHGVDLVCFSGDKLLGGPQAGIICGRRGLVDKVRRHPLARAVRADKLALASLAETLRAYLTGSAVRELPVWRMIASPLAEIETRAVSISSRLAESGLETEVIPADSTVGGGSLPGATLPTWVVALTHDRVDAFSTALRATPQPVIGRISEGRLLLDPRTVLPEQEEGLVETVTAVARDFPELRGEN